MTNPIPQVDETEFAETEFAEDFDPTNIVVNVSKKESEARSFEDLPVGKFQTTITDIDVVPSKSAKNKGKPMYRIEFTVSETGNEHHDVYVGQKAFTNACLWEGALYTIVNISNALGMGRPKAGEDWTIPKVDDLIGRELIIAIRRSKEHTVVDPKTGEKTTYEAKNEPKGFYALGSTTLKVPPKTSNAGVASSGGGSILP